MNLSLALLATFVAAAAPRKDDITFSSLSAEDLVENYFRNPEDLVEIRNVEASDHSCFALFGNGHYAGRHSVTNKFLLPNDGIIMSTGKPEDFHMNDSPETTTDFQIVLHGTNVLDPCFIQFEFSCPETIDIYTPQVSFDYVFGSEEYFHKKKEGKEVVDKEAPNREELTDILGFLLNGQNIALVPDENGGVATVPIEVNEKQNAQYFVNNKFKDSTSAYSTIEADGFTTKLTAQGTAKPGWNIIKLVIGDVVDGNLDSWVLLEAGTFSCALGEAPISFLRPTTEEVDEDEVKGTIVVASEEGETVAPRKKSDVAVFFIFIVALVVVGWVLLASGAVQLKGSPAVVAFGKPNFKPSEMKAKSIEMFGTIKAKIAEMYDTIRAKSTEKFGSKKVNPNESSATSSKAAKKIAEMYGTIKAKSTEKFGSKKVKPNESSATSTKQAAEQPVQQAVEQTVDEETDSNV